MNQKELRRRVRAILEAQRCGRHPALVTDLVGAIRANPDAIAAVLDFHSDRLAAQARAIGKAADDLFDLEREDRGDAEIYAMPVSTPQSRARATKPKRRGPVG